MARRPSRDDRRAGRTVVAPGRGALPAGRADGVGRTRAGQGRSRPRRQSRAGARGGRARGRGAASVAGGRRGRHPRLGAAARLDRSAARPLPAGGAARREPARARAGRGGHAIVGTAACGAHLRTVPAAVRDVRHVGRGVPAPPRRRGRTSSTRSWSARPSRCSQACLAVRAGRRCCVPTCTPATCSPPSASRGSPSTRSPTWGTPATTSSSTPSTAPGASPRIRSGSRHAWPPSPTWDADRVRLWLFARCTIESLERPTWRGQPGRWRPEAHGTRPPIRRESSAAADKAARARRSRPALSASVLSKVTATPATGCPVWSRAAAATEAKPARHLAVLGRVARRARTSTQHPPQSPAAVAGRRRCGRRTPRRPGTARAPARGAARRASRARSPSGARAAARRRRSRGTAGRGARSSTMYSTSRPCRTARCADSPTRSTSRASNGPRQPGERLLPQVRGAELERGDAEPVAALLGQVHDEAVLARARRAGGRRSSAAGRARGRARPAGTGPGWRARRRRSAQRPASAAGTVRHAAASVRAVWDTRQY